MLQEARRYGYYQLQGVERELLRPSRSLQMLLWVLWLLAIALSANFMWQGAVLAGEPVDILRIVLRSAVVGVIGLIVMTKIEMKAEPWRFLG